MKILKKQIESIRDSLSNAFNYLDNIEDDMETDENINYLRECLLDISDSIDIIDNIRLENVMDNLCSDMFCKK